MRLCFLIFFIFINLHNSSFASEEKIPSVLLKYNLQTMRIDGQAYLAINFKNNPHWHTYWKNPGDAGFGPKVQFTSLNGEPISFNALEWPSPGRYIEPGNIWAYGYEGEYSFFYQLPNNFNKNIKTELTWLICKHICIPGKSTSTIELERSIITNIKNEKNELALDNLSLETIKRRFENLPVYKEDQKHDIDIILAKEESTPNMLALFYNTTKLQPSNFLANRNLLFPYPHPYLEFKHEKLYKDKNGETYAKMLVEWNGMYEEPEVPFPQGNSLNNEITLFFDFYDSTLKKTFKVKKTFSQLYESKKLNSFFTILTPFEISKNASQKNDHDKTQDIETTNHEKKSNTGIFKYILLAILGGFILNFMPCVLPVISLKLFGLVNQSQQDKSQIIKHNLLYTAGVIVTFLIFSVIVIILQKSGQAIGWGFQMQSPTFIASISIFLFLFSLNLFGMYEFITPGGSTLGSIKIEGSKGDFLNGVLATILSTPCSAPFLGTALAFAFTSGPLIILSIFLSVGIGLASPFILTAAFPGTVKLFPKPGNWMNHFKKFLGLSLLLTVFWLLSIFIQLNTDDFSLYLLITLFMIGPVAIVIYQKFQKSIWILLIAFSLTIVGLFNIGKKNTEASIEQTISDQIQKFGLSWTRWNPDIVNEFQGARKKAFIDFTADWCLTCKVNEKLVINTDKFRSYVKESKIELIMGDWTDGDPEMTKWLQKNNMAGVPAYFIIDEQGNLHNLGETISIAKIKELIK